MELIYVLDLDYRKGCLNFTSSGNVTSKVKTVVFNNRKELIDAINQATPDIVLFDLYSKGQELESSKNNKVISKLKQVYMADTSNLKVLQEQALLNTQKYRQYARTLLEVDHSPTGIHEMKEVVNSLEVNIIFPIALFSRYGRQLITTESMLDVQKLGGYFVYKDKKINSAQRYENGFDSRELRSIRDIISTYKHNISRLDSSLLYEVKKIDRLNKKLDFTFVSRGIEYLFSIAIICAGIIHGGSIVEINWEVLGLAKFLTNFFSFAYLSPFMMLTGFIYLVVVTRRSKNVSLLKEANSYTTVLINDFIRTKSKYSSSSSDSEHEK
ncbi:hypothetical protein [Psychromonas ossibalaenae]|uniref:hypothetical protein n=1 Tax=Psychromonas ossibalaenae TaxID=444922 RepID=UPI00035F03C5|nr:hypothetical protein [Psychromonas ossibalaenae]